MNRRCAAWLIVLALAGGLSAGAQDKFLPFDETGVSKVVASHKGRVLLINFWATWCEPCRAEMPALARMQASLGAKGFRLVTVSADEPEDAPAAGKFLRDAKVAGPFYIKKAANDDKFITATDPKWSGALPFSMLFDRSGKKVKTYTGEVDLKALEADIRKLL